MMDTATFRVARYRFRSTVSHRWTGYLSIVLLVGLVGGLAMGSIAGARRTQSSYPTFLSSRNPSDLNVAVYDPSTDGGPGPVLTAKIARLPGVKRVRTLVAPTVVALSKDGTPRVNTFDDVTPLGSTDGLLTNQDRLAVLQGRLFNPDRPDQVVMTAAAANILGVRVGQVVPFGLFDHNGLRRLLVVHARVMGIVALDNQIVQDDIDRAYGFVVLTPAFMREAVAASPGTIRPAGYGIQLSPGASVPAVQRELVQMLPSGLTYTFHITSRVVSEVELAVKPESVALGAFGGIAALVALVLGIQAVARQLRLGSEDRQVMRALGATPAAAGGDGLPGVLGSVVLGGLLAAAVAVGLSPLTPLGPVRPVCPDGGVAFDWTVLLVGTAGLIIVLGTAAIVHCVRRAPNRINHDLHPTRRRPIGATAAEGAGLPVTAVVGTTFALEPSRGRAAVPMRSTLVGTILAIGLVVATLTFSSGLSTLVSSPPLYGWNWTYMLNPSNNVPPQATRLLDHDPEVAAWTGIAAYTSAELDGQTLPFLVTEPHPVVAPPILSGHGLQASNQVVLGASTMALLHKRVGDTVTLTVGGPGSGMLYVPPTTLHIVGTATLPAVGFSSFVSDHTSMGTGAYLSIDALPASFSQAVSNSNPNLNGPQLVFVRMRAGVSPARGRANLEQIAKVANRVFASSQSTAGNVVTVLGVQRPVQIVNYRSIGSTPVILAIGLALGSVVALTLTLIASVRSRRRDLALLKTLGFTPRQLASVIAWQSTVTAVIGIILGVPLGIVLGRRLWILFAQNINAVPRPTVPALAVVLVGVGALVFANLVAAVPGRIAARTPTAMILRAE
jgi:MacB-like periplasmic core domain/FtsX-like permease family